ncbi:hypothetical protein BJ165DRAFT_709444 [Panaeolus papilionaceus]|nr:hypothetical protein BJ165DRAFT_709444 [Panaeolus papilionaceus]
MALSLSKQKTNQREGYIPYDIVWLIISYTWSSNMSTDLRKQFMVSSSSVSKQWRSIFTRILVKDSYVPCVSYMAPYFKFLSPEWHGIDSDDNTFSNLCHSLTITLNANEKNSMNSFCDLFYKIRITDSLPNLRTLSIIYVGMPVEEVYNCYQFTDVPQSVVTLNLEYHHPAESSGSPIEPQSSSNSQSSAVDDLIYQPPWSLPFIRHLHLKGGDKRLATVLISACCRLESVTVDGNINAFDK